MSQTDTAGFSWHLELVTALKSLTACAEGGCRDIKDNAK
jgi:hypothetical protein